MTARRSSRAAAPARPVVLAAGGTGGHLFPAEALARALVRRGHEVALVTDPRGGTFGASLPQVRVHRISARQLGAGMIGRLAGLWALGIGFLQARRLLGRLKPAVVVGFGGYPSLPTVRAAASLSVPCLLHEQNSRLGRANRWLAGRARIIASSFPKLRGLPPGVSTPVVLTGNPVRAAVLARAGATYHAPGPAGPIRLLVFGGSQGARVFSRVVPDAFKALPSAVKRRLEVTQQCRPEDLDQARAAYAATGVRVALDSFFADLPDRISGSHLIVARAGASTIAELAVVGRPSILVPYPHATDDHQSLNAERFADAGGCWAIAESDFTAARLAQALVTLFDEPDALVTLAEAALAFARPDAAEDLAREVVRLGRLNGDRNGGGRNGGDRAVSGRDRPREAAA